MAASSRTVHIVRRCWLTFQSSRHFPVLYTGTVAVEDNASLHPPLARYDPLVLRQEVWKDLMTSKAIPFMLYTPLATTRPLLCKLPANHPIESPNISVGTYLPAVAVDPTVQPREAVTKRKLSNSIHLSSVVKKRRRHMNRHKYRKRRKAQRFLRRRLGK